jgi:hypothetical protein
MRSPVVVIAAQLNVNRHQMRSACLILVLALFSSTAAAAKPGSPCPSTADFDCLVQNSIAVYEHDYEHWWRIYHAGFQKALRCRTYTDVATYLNLWTGGTNGEMSEGLTEDTSKLLVKKPKCFFEGVIAMRSNARSNLIERFCPWADPEEPFLKVLRRYERIEKNHFVVEPLLHRVVAKKCI